MEPIANDPVSRANGAVPSPRILAYARRTLRRRFHLASSDLDDLIAEALLEFLRSGPLPVSADGLFLTIARRLAGRRLRRPRDLLLRGEIGRVEPDTDRLEGQLIERLLIRRARGSGHADLRRLKGVLHAILAGDPFAEACRGNGIPRGSHSRYREILRKHLRPIPVAR
jgi:hypothetical protein